MTRQTTEDSGDDFPWEIDNPARRALLAAGYQRLGQLTTVTERDVGQLDGVGPKALRALTRSLAERGQSFAATEPRQDREPGTLRQGSAPRRKD